MQIEYHQQLKTTDDKFSIIIPTWNNLSLLQLCIRSILKNSTYRHQIIVHINDGSDGTLDWVKTQQLDYTYSSENIGICKAVNAAYSLAQCNYIVYLNDDMYVCPEWDLHIDAEIKTIGHDYFYLSSTMIEPVESGNKCIIGPCNFGKDANTFREKELLAALSTLHRPDWSGSTWPPSIMHRRLWNIIGGYSIEFSPGMYSDPDIAMKLWKADVRYFKGLGKSIVYHFMSKSTGKVVKNNGRSQFLRKWKMANSTFSNFYLKTGTPFALSTEPTITFALKNKLLRDRIKLWVYTILNK